MTSAAVTASARKPSQRGVNRNRYTHRGYLPGMAGFAPSPERRAPPAPLPHRRVRAGPPGPVPGGPGLSPPAGRRAV